MNQKQFLLFSVTFLSLILIFCIDLAKSDNADSDFMKWQAYKKKYNKFYPKTFSHHFIESMRKRIFDYNRKFVDDFNTKYSTEAGFELDTNHLSDLFPSEIKKLFGYKLSSADRNAIIRNGKRPRNSEKAQEYLDKILSNDVEVPDAIDWRKVKGRVTPVKDQGLCSSCWAFATTGVLEGQLAVRNKSFIHQMNSNRWGLSEQNLIDFCPNNKGNCQGGTMQDAMVFIKEENGIDNDNYYPYVGKERDCKFDRNAAPITDSGSAFLTEGDEQELKAIVAKFGPVSVAIDASDRTFTLYKTGIVYYSSLCSNNSLNLNHAVLVVGYGTDPKYNSDYWIVKNSWSEKWGDEGYIKMARNRDNNCGIATNAVIPTFG